MTVIRKADIDGVHLDGNFMKNKEDNIRHFRLNYSIR